MGMDITDIDDDDQPVGTVSAGGDEPWMSCMGRDVL